MQPHPETTKSHQEIVLRKSTDYASLVSMCLRAPIPTLARQACLCPYTHGQEQQPARITPIFLLSTQLWSISSLPLTTKSSVQPQTCLFHWTGKEFFLQTWSSIIGLLVTIMPRKKHQLHFRNNFGLWSLYENSHSPLPWFAILYHADFGSCDWH